VPGISKQDLPMEENPKKIYSVEEGGQRSLSKSVEPSWNSGKTRWS
jgi:hypothetical protein